MVLSKEQKPSISTQAAKQPRVRGRGWPVAVAGSAAMVLCSVLAFWLVSNLGEERRMVLVAAVSMPAGHVITATDVDEVAVASDDLAVIEAEAVATIVGQTVAVPVSPGTVLSPQLLGEAVIPEPGRAETAMVFAEGSYPAGIEAGQSVVLIATADAAGREMAAIVRSVSPVNGGALVGLEFDAADRAVLAATRAEEPFLVAVAPRGGE